MLDLVVFIVGNVTLLLLGGVLALIGALYPS